MSSYFLTLSLLVCIGLCGKIVEYKFGVVYDYSGNNRHAVNGESSSTNDFDTMPTDRGAFFAKDVENRIKLPPNDLDSNNFYISPKFSLVLWVLTGANSGINNKTSIFYRYTSDQSFIMKIKKSDIGNQILAKFYYEPYNSGPLFGSNNSLKLEQWQLIIKTFDTTTGHIYTNGKLEISYTCTLDFSELHVDFPTYVGSYDGIDISFHGFIWYLAIFNDIIEHLDYYRRSFSPENCLVGECPSVCDPSIFLDGEQYCLSINLNPSQNGNYDLCPSGCSYGCSGSLCLDCKCSFKSCTVLNSEINCLCPVNSTASATTCECHDEYYFSFWECLSCHQECKKCIQPLKCTECKFENSIISGTEGCTCLDNFYAYYSTGSSYKTDCKPCHEDCLTCEKPKICLQCKNSNTIISQIEGCNCINGYYMDEITRKCYECDKDCSLCTKSQCLQCKSENIQIVGTKCECQAGFFNSSINGILSCSACQDICQSCIDNNTCLQCKKKYSNPVEDSCKCPENSNELFNACVCKDGYFMQNISNFYSCSPCKQLCLTCLSFDQCTSCQDESLIVDDNYNCVPDCKVGYYASDLICIKCADLCNVCSNGNSCDKCVDNAEVINGTCFCKKEEGFYANDQKCVKCADLCKVCSNGNSCDKCVDNAEVINGTCFCKREEGYYANDQKCVKCADLCKVCSNGNSCDKCVDNAEVINGICFCKKEEGFYANDLNCIKCADLCKVCSNGNSCDKCVDNAEVINGTCFCKREYRNEDEKCVENIFSAVISVNQLNKVGILFLEETEHPLKSYSINISLSPAYPFNYKSYYLNSTFLYLEMEFASSIPKGTKIFIDLSSNTIYSKSGKILDNYVYNNELYEYIYYKSSEEVDVIIKSTASALKNIGTAVISCGLISNPSAAWPLLSTIQLISYIRLGSNPLTPQLRTFLGGLGQYEIIPNLGYLVFSPNSSTQPYLEARKYGFQSSVFWINLGETFAIFFAILSLWPILKLARRSKFLKNSAKVKKILANYRYSFFIRFWIQAYLDIGICAIIQLRSVKFI
ncbi:hypothetical protein SteCoe_36085 [Stentor coeruleus]|uniref:EGF-like domain-containing protein n=1 Tax=Stentor coeruleus TaxID=5963 RepID=A0A1R2AQW7_9CILI|nr:hypothetical protein SteCoe_36085 [Stentor coeruleus]